MPVAFPIHGKVVKPHDVVALVSYAGDAVENAAGKSLASVGGGCSATSGRPRAWTLRYALDGADWARGQEGRRGRVEPDGR